MLQVSEHAHIRCAQRQIRPECIAFIKKHGRKFRRTGIMFYFFGKRDIPKVLRHDDLYSKLVGVTLLVGRDGELITAYRNPNGLKAIRKKTKYRLPGAPCGRLHDPL